MCEAASVVETDDLWGGNLVSVTFDPVTWTLRFGVEVLDSDESRRYELKLDGVTQWRSSRSVPLPWNYAELTEVHLSDTEDQVVVDLVLWADGTTLSARCAGVRLDRLP
jgi:hypothetical protein